jgi:membrane protein implicated in regulation of membrane protease activity
VNQVEGVAPGPVDGDGPDIGWGRAIGSGLAILVVGFVAAVYGVNSVATKLTGVSRSTRQYLASALFLVVVVALAWVLRRLQARRLI